MRIVKSTKSRVLERFTAYMASNGKRTTPECMKILEAVLELGGKITIEDIAIKLESDGFAISKASIYNTFALLTDAGIIVRQEVEASGRTSYDVCSANRIRMVCSRCGATRQIRDSALEAVIAAKRYTRFNAESYSLTFYGICAACTKQDKTNKK